MSDKKYFCIEKKHVLYTEDNWNNVLFNKNDKIKYLGYEEEKDASKIHVAKLIFNYGKKLTEIIINEYNKIDEAFFNLKNRHLNPQDGYGQFFEIFSISVLHDISYTKVIADHLINGSSDGVVDAAYYDESSVVFYQIKLGNLTNDNTLILMEDNINEFLNTGKIEDPTAKDLCKFLNKHYEHDIYGKDIDYRTISINSHQANNKTPDEIFNLYLTKLVERNKIVFKNSIEIRKDENNQFAINVVDADHKEVFVFVNAKSLIDTLEKHIESENNIDYLFVDNVRGRLNKNNSLIQTIKNEPELFCFYNNGISIIGQFPIQAKNPYIVVQNPIIINGQQTVMSLFAAKKDGADISKVHVPVFLKSVTNEEQLRKIAKYNNTQTKISSLDLLSIDHNLRKIQASLIEDMLDDMKNGEECYYLDVVRNGKNKHKAYAKQLFGKNNIITAGEFVKLYSAINNHDELGSWKNSLDTNLKKKYKSGFDYVEKEMAHSICKTIHDSKIFIGNNNNYKIADLSIQLLAYYGYSFDDIKTIIDSINADSDSKNVNRANVFRQSGALEAIKEAISKNNLDDLLG